MHWLILTRLECLTIWGWSERY